VYGLTSTQPDQPTCNDESVKIPSARKTNQQPTRSHKSSMSRHLHLTVFQLLVRCAHPRASDILRTWSTIARSVILCFIVLFQILSLRVS